MVDQDIQAKLALLRKNYKEKLVDKIGLIAAYEDTDDLTHLKDLCHQLAGTAGTYGFLKIGEQMKELELEIVTQLNQPSPYSQMPQNFYEKARSILMTGLD